MTPDTEPLVHHEEADYSSDDGVSTDDFTPSLPTLINRPPDFDTDARSVSDVDSISNGETVSDAGADADYDEISYDEIPALAARTASARSQEVDPSEEEMERVMMSDRTIIPETPVLAQRMPQLSSELSTISTLTPQHARLTGLSLSEKPYQLPNRPLRLVLMTDGHTTNLAMTFVVSKVVGAMTGSVADRESVQAAALNAESDSEILPSLIDLPTPVDVTRTVTYRVGLGNDPLITQHDETIINLKNVQPDLVIFYRTNGHAKGFIQFAKKVAFHKIPMLEVAGKTLDLTDDDSNCSCVIPHSAQGEDCLRLSLVSSLDGEDEKVHDVPLSLSAFHALDDDVLGRHLAYLADRATETDETDAVTDKDNKFKLSSLIESPLAKNIAQSLVALLMVLFAASLPMYLLQQQSPTSELATRTPMLQAALNSSGLANVNASDILRYPTTTDVVGNSTTTAVAFPTTVHVHVVKSDQLLVSLPKTYWKSAQIGIFKNGKALSNINNTRVIDGVLSVSLPSTDAHGQVQVSVLSTNTPLRNETIKVDLGNRLLQRVTYENAAKGVQQDVTEAHHAAKLAQAKVLSDVHSVFNSSIYCIRTFGNNIFEGVKSTGNAIGSASNHTSQSLSYMGGITYNTTSNIGSFVKSAIPQKRHFVRARNNALKIRTRLLRGSSAVKQKVVEPKPGALPRALSAFKERFSGLQQQLSSGVDALKRSSPLEPRGKTSATYSKVQLTVKTVVQPKSKQRTSSGTNISKCSKGRKQCTNPDKKLKSSCV